MNSPLTRTNNSSSGAPLIQIFSPFRHHPILDGHWAFNSEERGGRSKSTGIDRNLQVEFENSKHPFNVMNSPLTRINISSSGASLIQIFSPFRHHPLFDGHWAFNSEERGRACRNPQALIVWTPLGRESLLKDSIFCISFVGERTSLARFQD
ncbi:hypothetical protein CDAR_219301 [Caerostris darwini]|uniref:Uncharacterized protein n=1 Tax=Caerostris darwini TaxID=1538125 RepID=A0AAV4PKY3_9ARAC|nr:hypothetical protein CDAR_219301 [Caerostris darwini]